MEQEPKPALLNLFLADLIGASPLGFVALGVDDTVILCEGGTEQILGRPKSAIMGCSAREIPLIGSAVAKLVSRLSESAVSISYYDLELEGRGLDGSKMLDLHLSIAPNLGGKILTIQPKGQSSVGSNKPSQRSRMMAHLSTALAHEIKNPLSGIRAAAQLAAKSLPDSKTHLTEMVVAETKRLTGLLDQLQNATDRDPLVIGPVNLHETINHVCAVLDGTLSEQTNLRLRFDPSLPDILGSSDGLVQILMNLILNAQEAAADEPITITITTRYRQGFQSNNVGEKSKSLPVEIEISDDGPGVPPELEQDLFDPFVSGKEAGRGLGLAIVVWLIEDMGAHIRYERAQPHGARFLINLARADQVSGGQTE